MIRYSEIVQGDIREVIRLYERYLNSGTYIRNDMLEAFHAGGYIGYKAEEGGRVVGIVSGRRGIAFTYPHPRLEKELCGYTGGRNVYTVDSLLVLPGYRHQGIARSLIYYIRRRMKEIKTEIALAEIWVYPDEAVPAAPAFRHLGRVIFHRVIPQFYKENTVYKISCPICGESCRCAAVVKMYLL